MTTTTVRLVGEGTAQHFSSNGAGPEHSEQPAGHWRNERFGVRDFLNRPSKQWLVQDLIGVRDEALIFGVPGSGKTLIVIDLAVSAALGCTFAGAFAVTRPLTVAYCTSEGVSGLADRLRAACAHYGTSDMPLYVFTSTPQLFNRQGEDGIFAFVREWKEMAAEGIVPEHLDLLIIDTLHGATTGADENGAGDMGVVLDSLRYARDMLGCATVLVHHANKGGEVERGSTALRGAMDCIVKTGKAGSVFTMEASKMKDGREWKPKTLRLVEVEGTGSVRVEWLDKSDGDDEGGKRGTVDERVFKFLSDNRGVYFSAAEVSMGVYGTESQTNNVRRSLNGLADGGAVQMEMREGRSGAVDKPREVKCYAVP